MCFTPTQHTMIPRSHNSISIILLVQFFVIIAGTLLTTGMLKLHGYPDADDFIWNPVSEFIRNWGWLALFLPIACLFLVCRSGFLGESRDLSPGSIAILIFTTLALLLFYAWTSLTAATFSNKAYLSNKPRTQPLAAALLR